MTSPATDTGTKTLKVAQVGVGNFGATRRRSMRATGLFDLVAAYDLRPEALRQAEAEDGATPVDSFEALLDRDDIEAVIICSGAKFHAEQIIAAAQRKLHVFVEKPLCATRAEMEAILVAEEEYGVVIGVGHTDHTASAMSCTTKQLIDSGKIGTIVSFENTTAHSGGLHLKPEDWRANREANPGGMLFHCGVHAAHELMYYFGPITSVSAQMRYDVHTSTTADAALCHLTFANGVIGTLNAFHVTPYRHSLHLYGTEANLYRNERFYGESTSLLIQPRSHSGGAEPMCPVTLTSKSDGASNLRSFYNAIRHGTPVYPSARDGARALAVVFAAEESAEKGGVPIKIADF